MYVLTSAEMEAILTAMVASGGDFFGGKLSVFADDITPTKNTAFGDFANIVASNGFTAGNAITWGTPYLNDNGGAEVLGNTHSFLSTSAPGSPITIYGYLITDSGGTSLLLAERFQTPFVLSRTAQLLALAPKLTLDV